MKICRIFTLTLYALSYKKQTECEHARKSLCQHLLAALCISNWSPQPGFLA